MFNDTVVNSLLSILDSSSVDEGFNITNYAETSTDNYASTYGRRDVNRVYFNFTDVMSNIEISCKFSIQTFQVDFYNILDDNGDTLSLKEGTIISCYSKGNLSIGFVQYGEKHEFHR